MRLHIRVDVGPNGNSTDCNQGDILCLNILMAAVHMYSKQTYLLFGIPEKHVVVSSLTSKWAWVFGAVPQVRSCRVAFGS